MGLRLSLQTLLVVALAALALPVTLPAAGGVAASVERAPASRAALHGVRPPESDALLQAARVVPPVAPVRLDGGSGGGHPADANPIMVGGAGQRATAHIGRRGAAPLHVPTFASTGGCAPYFSTAPPLHG